MVKKGGIEDKDGAKPSDQVKKKAFGLLITII